MSERIGPRPHISEEHTFEDKSTLRDNARRLGKAVANFVETNDLADPTKRERILMRKDREISEEAVLTYSNETFNAEFQELLDEGAVFTAPLGDGGEIIATAINRYDTGTYKVKNPEHHEVFEWVSPEMSKWQYRRLMDLYAPIKNKPPQTDWSFNITSPKGKKTRFDAEISLPDDSNRDREKPILTRIYPIDPYTGKRHERDPSNRHTAVNELEAATYAFAALEHARQEGMLTVEPYPEEIAHETE